MLIDYTELLPSDGQVLLSDKDWSTPLLKNAEIFN